MKDHALKSGVILGVVGILISLIVYIIDPLLMIKWWFSLSSLVLFIALVSYFGIQYREMLGGFVSFKIAYIYSILTFVLAGLIGTAFSILLFQVIDPDLPQLMSEAIIEQTVEMMEGFGANQEIIDEAIEDADPAASFTVMGQIKSFGMVLIFYAVMSLITGAIIKRKVPDFTE
ncbi:DUF4199 domain-containing protein [Cyclobacteriaceae bacterium]|jgi:hypothetical protein|nr:DUF4199 domain-containing protein [Cyclobacteriaceae bacterium]|tara:strand:- start:163 stop:684 length:522 start_codon:yes stop_codon:yes gene_type:complete